MCELIFAIRTDWFFLLGINVAQSIPSVHPPPPPPPFRHLSGSCLFVGPGGGEFVSFKFIYYINYDKVLIFTVNPG